MTYGTGDSLGHSTGNIDILHCTNNQEAADALSKQIIENSDAQHFEFVDDFGRTIRINNHAWGYFESLESINVESFDL